MAIRITAIRLTGGTKHEHISDLWWTNPSTGASDVSTRKTIVDWIENQSGYAFVQDRFGDKADVGVVTPQHGEKYLRTYADSVWTDNLLALPHR
jgi:hypothetical protein